MEEPAKFTIPEPSVLRHSGTALLELERVTFGYSAGRNVLTQVWENRTSSSREKESEYRTVADMVLVYGGNRYPYSNDFGYGYEEDSARYMFFDGNYSCDCNKSLFLMREGYDIQELGCGDEIEIEDFTLKYIHKDGAAKSKEVVQ